MSLDTLRADYLGSYGNPDGWSANLDAYAASATVFDDMSSSSNNTLSTHTALFASRQPTFALQLARDEARDERDYSLPAHLGRADIRTAIFGNGPIFRVSATQDFSVSARHEKGRDGIRQAIDWMTKRSKTDEEFFLFLHLYDLHDPYYESKDLISRDRRMDDRAERLTFQLELKAKGDQALRTAYGEGLRYLDHFLGELFTALVDVAKQRRLLVVLTSDHAEAFGEHRDFYYHTQYLYQEIVHVPLIVRDYGQKTVERLRCPVSTVDLAPTIAGFFGLEPQSPVQGINLLPLMHGEEPPVRYVFAEGRDQRERLVRDDRYKLIRYRLPNMPEVELFDLRSDPGEQHDLASSRPGVASKLDKVLTNYFNAEAVRLGLKSELPDRDIRELKRKLEALGYVGR